VVPGGPTKWDLQVCLATFRPHPGSPSRPTGPPSARTRDGRQRRPRARSARPSEPTTTTRPGPTRPTKSRRPSRLAVTATDRTEWTDGRCGSRRAPWRPGSSARRSTTGHATGAQRALTSRRMIRRPAAPSSQSQVNGGAGNSRGPHAHGGCRRDPSPALPRCGSASPVHLVAVPNDHRSNSDSTSACPAVVGRAAALCGIAVGSVTRSRVDTPRSSSARTRRPSTCETCSPSVRHRARNSSQVSSSTLMRAVCCSKAGRQFRGDPMPTYPLRNRRPSGHSFEISQACMASHPRSRSCI